MPTPSIEAVKIAETIEDIVQSYATSLEPIQADMYNRALTILKDLSLSKDGTIKQTVGNYKTIGKVRTLFKREMESDKYLSKVAMVQEHFNEISVLQKAYFTTMFTSFAEPAVIAEIKRQAILSTVESLTEGGINSIVADEASNIVMDNIREGASFKDMSKELEKFVEGNDKVPGKLVSYSKQIMTDATAQYAGNYNKIISADLDLTWYEYVGGKIKTSRPMCVTLVDKVYIHESELKGIVHGRVDGEEVSTQGFMPGTTAENFMINRGGFNCQHLLMPVSDEAVPAEVRERVI